MATLQKIRSKGPLLLIVIGLAMLAFILGDAWKMFNPNGGAQYVGSIAGEKISAQDFQKELEDYTEIIKFGLGTNEISEELNNQLKDEVWRTIIRDRILEKESKALGLAVSDEEIRFVIEQGTHPALKDAVMFCDNNGNFDADILKSFIPFYESIDRSSYDAQTLESYDMMYKFWLFIEREIRNDLLGAKYVTLVETSINANAVTVQNSYENRIKRYDVLVAAMPYSMIPDADAVPAAQDLKAAYARNKERLFNYAETRNVYYIDYEILPSQEDREALAEEMNDYTMELEESEGDYAALLHRALSGQTFSEVARSAEYLPLEVVARIDSVNSNGVCGPIYNADEDSYTSFKLIKKVDGYDSIQYNLMSIQAGTDAETARLSDSIFNAVKAGADFEELASKYGQSGAAQWISSDQYEPAALSGDNAKFLNTLNSMKKGQVENIAVTGANLILKVTDVRKPTKKYVVATIKRPVEFGEETSSKAYNDLNLFVAKNNNIDSLKSKAEDAGFRLLYNSNVTNQSYYIGGIARSHEALRWAFEAEKGEVSRVFEAGAANDHLLVVAVDDITPEGYVSLQQASRSITPDAVKEIKYRQLLAKLDGVKSFEDAQAVEGVQVDTIKFCNFTNNVYLPSSMVNEPVLGPAANKLANGEMSSPVKGQSSVFVVKKISDDALAVEFDEPSEVYRVNTLSRARFSSQALMDELVNQYDIKDTRYRIF